MIPDFFDVKNNVEMARQNEQMNKKMKKSGKRSYPSFPHKIYEKTWKNRYWEKVIHVIHTKTYVFGGQL